MCTDGRGAGNNLGPMAGKCLAREILALLKKSTTPQIFRKLVWENAHKIYALKA